ncbi:unnamed protein product [Gordionus sp. m RMFG-2023]
MLKCSNCGEELKQWCYLSIEESKEISSGRGYANLVIKCKFCSRENSISITNNVPHKYDEEDERYKTFAIFECRGIEPIGFSPREGFLAKSSESETTFDNISLKENEWVDYDEKAGCAVGIYDLESKFIRL